MERASKKIIKSDRAKELNSLYEILRRMVTPNCTTEEIMQAILDVLLSSWQYPKVTCARITCNGWTINSDDWKKPNGYKALTLLTAMERLVSLRYVILKKSPN